MFKKKTKIVEVGEGKYLLSKLDARSASYLALKAAAVLAPALKSGTVDVDGIAGILPKMSREEFDEIQTMLLQTVCKLTNINGADMSTPVIRKNGDFVDEEMAYDAQAVIKLTAQALFFNVGDFFGEAGLAKKPAK